MASETKLLDPHNRDDMICFANSAWDSFDWEMNIAIPNQRQGKDGPMNDSQAKLDDWMEATGRELYEEIVPPDFVILPRAEVEALRARAERLRGTIERWLTPLMWEDAVEDGDLHPGDLADNLRPLDDLTNDS